MTTNKKDQKVNSKTTSKKLSFEQALKVSAKLEKKGFVLSSKDQKNIISAVSTAALSNS